MQTLQKRTVPVKPAIHQETAPSQKFPHINGHFLATKDTPEGYLTPERMASFVRLAGEAERFFAAHPEAVLRSEST